MPAITAGYDDRFWPVAAYVQRQLYVGSRLEVIVSKRLFYPGFL